MASHMKHPVIIDFFGLPACGKSTISHELAEKLRSQGFIVCEPTYHLDHNVNFIRRKFVKLIRCFVFSFLNPKKAKKVRKLVKENGYSFFSGKLSQYVNICNKLYVIRKEKCDYIIFDEGVFQAAISLALLRADLNCIDSNLNTILSVFEKNVELKSVYLRAEADSALARLQERGERASRVDAEKDNKKRNTIINVFYNLCEKLSNLSTLQMQTESMSVDDIIDKLELK